MLSALSLLAGLSTLLRPAPGLTRGLSVVDLVLDVAIIALLVMRPSPDYFRRSV